MKGFGKVTAKYTEMEEFASNELYPGGLSLRIQSGYKLMPT